MASEETEQKEALRPVDRARPKVTSGGTPWGGSQKAYMAANGHLDATKRAKRAPKSA